MSEDSLIIKKSYLDLPLFKQAFVHKSISSKENNERLEFLGDAVLEIIISEFLYNQFSEMNEGKLTQIRASLVNTQSLAEIFLQFNCKDMLQTSKGTQKLDESHKHSIYAGTLEACIGAIFIELGFDESKIFVQHLFQEKFSFINEHTEFKDAKSRLQEALQAKGYEPPKYLVESNKEGNCFDCKVEFNGEIFHASASLKKESEQMVAELILLTLDQL